MHGEYVHMETIMGRAGRIPRTTNMSADFELTDSLIEDLLHVIANLMHKKCSSLFHEPVDYVGLKLNDYLDVIKRPMDLTTLRTNLRER